MGKCIINNKECIWVKTVLLSYLQGERSKIICNCAVCSDETTVLPGYIVPAKWLPGPEPGVPGGGHIYCYLYLLLIYLYYLCLPLQVWQPADEPPIYNQECEVYDGSLIPDCDYFLNNYTSYYHVHEYSETCWHCRGTLICKPSDCSKFWECSPSGPCLMECSTCDSGPMCPDGFLHFDCRLQTNHHHHSIP